MDPKVVVVTGASSGIGAELARQLARKGHKLVLAARTKARLDEVARECGPGTLVVVADVTRRADVERIRDEAIRRFGHVDVWVNNAGQGINKRLMDVTEEDLDAILAIDVKSVFYGIKAIVPHFQERGRGHVINVSSFMGRVPLASMRSVYNAAKAFVNSMTANLRTDLARTHPDVHVSLVMPSIVATPFHANCIAGTDEIPRGAPPQTAEEVAAQIVELIRHPRAEVYTAPQQHGIVQSYFADVEAFESRARQGEAAGARPPARSP